MRAGCVRIADRYHLASVRNVVAAILEPQMSRAPAVTCGQPGPGGAHRGVVRETTHSDEAVERRPVERISFE